MEVLIVSKTHLGTGACVGGIILENLQFVRLMSAMGQYQPGDTEFKIGDIWEMDLNKVPDIKPHIEDAIVSNPRFVRRIADINEFIVNNCKVWEGGPEILFDDLIRWTNRGSGFIQDKNSCPQQSVGFWIPDRDLVIEEDKYYVYKYKRPLKLNKRLNYKGFDEMVSVIPAGTLCRVSLSKWWKPKDEEYTGPERCYLQLSGWY